MSASDQATEMAKSEVNRKCEKDKSEKHKNIFIPPLQPKCKKSADRIQNIKFKMNRDDCHQDQLSLFVPALSDTSLKSRNG